jgi:UrcA family protein
MIKTALFAAAAAFATIATASPVLARDVVVRYADLDLTTAKGQRDLSHRIHRAARVACELQAENRIPSQEALACYRQAQAKARTEMALLVENVRLGG